MPHDLDIANGSGAAVRADINGALAALGSNMKGPNAPPSPRAGMVWVEDDNPSSTRWSVRMFDGADWITMGVLDTTTNRFEVSSTATGLALLFAADGAAARNILDVPLRPTTAIWDRAVFADNTAAVLPAGGTWAYNIQGYNTTTGTTTFVADGQVLPGGTTVGAATPGVRWVVDWWRVA